MSVSEAIWECNACDSENKKELRKYYDKTANRYFKTCE